MLLWPQAQVPSPAVLCSFVKPLMALLQNSNHSEVTIACGHEPLLGRTAPGQQPQGRRGLTRGPASSQCLWGTDWVNLLPTPPDGRNNPERCVCVCLWTLLDWCDLKLRQADLVLICFQKLPKSVEVVSWQYYPSGPGVTLELSNSLLSQTPPVGYHLSLMLFSLRTTRVISSPFSLPLRPGQIRKWHMKALLFSFSFPRQRHFFSVNL